MQDKSNHDSHLKRHVLQYTAVVDGTRVDDRSLIRRASRHELLRSLTQARICTGCGRLMHIDYSTSVPNGARWRRPVCTCSRTYGNRRNSWTYDSELALRQIAFVVTSWCERRSAGRAVVDCEGSERTLIKFCQKFRGIAAEAYRQDLADHLMGETGDFVQVDESHFFRAKCNIGSALARPQMWFFGAIDCLTNMLMMYMCEYRTAELLVYMICLLCVPGCEIWSDEWRAYQCIEHHGFVHRTVNHSENYVDPDTGVHTNRIEGSWGASINSYGE